MLVIAFGHKAQNGKDTAAQAIIEKYPSVKRYAFADAIKSEVYAALIDELDPFWAEHDDLWQLVLPSPPHYTNDIQEQVAWIDGVKNRDSVRRVLQVYGSEWRRAQDPLYWVYCLSKRLHEEKPTVALITDMRFKNEFYWVKGLEGVTVNVVRVGYENGYTHASEHDLNGAPYDYLLATGDVEALRSGAVRLFERILEDKNVTLETVPVQLELPFPDMDAFRK